MKFNTDFFIQTLGVTLRAIPITLKLTIVVLIISVPIAFLFALIRLKEKSFWKKVIAVYISLARGTPMIIQILAIYSMLPSALYTAFQLFGIRIDIYEINPIIYAYFIFSFNTIAILTEIFRSAMNTVDNGQLEAAESAGLTAMQAYIRIIIPQAIVGALPNICNATTSLIKNTSLAFAMTIKEITAVAKIEAAYGYNYLEAYLDVWIVYIMIIILVEFIFKHVESKVTIYKKC
jgi:L-cystine transport system permease protein